jgi:hypothetical protein
MAQSAAHDPIAGGEHGPMSNERGCAGTILRLTVAARLRVQFDAADRASSFIVDLDDD